MTWLESWWKWNNKQAGVKSRDTEMQYQFEPRNDDYEFLKKIRSLSRVTMTGTSAAGSDMCVTMLHGYNSLGKISKPYDYFC